MKLFKSKAGFTLIELLVVIGILAVLAAIAIPSVAGLIDRANVSADKTNSNEMTNAVERFASEYELYCQDIASGVIKESTTDFDSAQGRVYNVTGVKTRAGIETLEVAQDAVVTDDQIAIYRDTKYPVNAKTMQKVVENYTKTSSSTFEPKQSDMHYWYSPDCGVVVFAEPDADVEADLNSQIQSGQDAKGNDLGPTTQWIDLTLGVALSGGSASLPEVGKTLEQYTWAEVKSIISNGKATEYGFEVGATKTLTYNSNSYTARIIGLNQDGTNTATFMFTSSIGNHVMNPYDDNIGYGVNTGGFAASNMNSWLNSTAYGLLGDDVKSAITPVTKTNNLGMENPTGTSQSSCKLFLLSVEEVGLKEELNGWGWYPYMDSIDAESTSTYTYFQTSGQSRRQEISNNTNYNWWWLRSANSNGDSDFFGVDDCGDLSSNGADYDFGVVPAFVIG